MAYKGHLSWHILGKASPAKRVRALHHQFPNLMPLIAKLGVAFTANNTEHADSEEWISLDAKLGEMPVLVMVGRPYTVRKGVVYTTIRVVQHATPTYIFQWQYFNEADIRFSNNFAKGVLHEG